MGMQFKKPPSRGKIDKLTKLVRTAYHIAKKQKTFAEFHGLIELQNLNGNEIGETYSNDKKCKEFVDAIHAVLLDDFVSEVNEANMFSILCDGSTDSGN